MLSALKGTAEQACFSGTVNRTGFDTSLETPILGCMRLETEEALGDTINRIRTRILFAITL